MKLYTKQFKSNQKYLLIKCSKLIQLLTRTRNERNITICSCSGKAENQNPNHFLFFFFFVWTIIISCSFAVHRSVRDSSSFKSFNKNEANQLAQLTSCSEYFGYKVFSDFFKNGIRKNFVMILVLTFMNVIFLSDRVQNY